MLIAGEVVAPIRPDLPRGLNQLGNTCYLNSLLQVCTARFTSIQVLTYFLYSTFIPSRISEKRSNQCQNWILLHLMTKNYRTKTLNAIGLVEGLWHDGKLCVPRSVCNLQVLIIVWTFLTWMDFSHQPASRVILQFGILRSRRCHSYNWTC